MDVLRKCSGLHRLVFVFLVSIIALVLSANR
jgi:hypothetical protein